MFVVIYRAYILSNKEAEYLLCWKIIAEHFVQERGALESSVHKTEEGYWLACSKWPSKTKRDASWPPPPSINSKILEAAERLKSCFDTEKPDFDEICMDLKGEVKSLSTICKTETRTDRKL